MVSIKSSLVRTLGIAAVAAGVLFSSALSVSADSRSGSLSTLPSSPPPTSIDLKAPAAPAEREVIIGNITPEQGRTSAAGELKANTAPARGGTTGLGAADDFKAGVGCSIQCITSGVAHARGVGANLVVKTDTPANIWIIVWNEDGYHKMVQSGFGQTQFAHHFDDLEPGTFYYAMAAAEDSQGYTSHGYGNFTTLTRSVRITYTQAIIHDKPFNSSFWTMAWLQDAVIDDSDGLVPEGDVLPLGIHIHELDNVGQFLTMQVLLHQDDPDYEVCEVLSPHSGPESGSFQCHQFAYAEFQGGSLDLDHRPTGATSWTHHSIETNLVLPGGNALPGGYGQPLDFHVPVSIEVTYE